MSTTVNKAPPSSIHEKNSAKQNNRAPAVLVPTAQEQAVADKQQRKSQSKERMSGRKRPFSHVGLVQTRFEDAESDNEIEVLAADAPQPAMPEQTTIDEPAATSKRPIRKCRSLITPRTTPEVIPPRRPANWDDMTKEQQIRHQKDRKNALARVRMQDPVFRAQRNQRARETKRAREIKRSRESRQQRKRGAHNQECEEKDQGKSAPNKPAHVADSNKHSSQQFQEKVREDNNVSKKSAAIERSSSQSKEKGKADGVSSASEIMEQEPDRDRNSSSETTSDEIPPTRPWNWDDMTKEEQVKYRRDRQNALKRARYKKEMQDPVLRARDRERRRLWRLRKKGSFNQDSNKNEDSIPAPKKPALGSDGNNDSSRQRKKRSTKDDAIATIDPQPDSNKDSSLQSQGKRRKVAGATAGVFSPIEPALVTDSNKGSTQQREEKDQNDSGATAAEFSPIEPALVTDSSKDNSAAICNRRELQLNVLKEEFGKIMSSSEQIEAGTAAPTTHIVNNDDVPIIVLDSSTYELLKRHEIQQHVLKAEFDNIMVSINENENSAFAMTGKCPKTPLDSMTLQQLKQELRRSLLKEELEKTLAVLKEEGEEEKNRIPYSPTKPGYDRTVLLRKQKQTQINTQYDDDGNDRSRKVYSPTRPSYSPGPSYSPDSVGWRRAVSMSDCEKMPRLDLDDSSDENVCRRDLQSLQPQRRAREQGISPDPKDGTSIHKVYVSSSAESVSSIEEVSRSTRPKDDESGSMAFDISVTEERDPLAKTSLDSENGSVDSDSIKLDIPLPRKVYRSDSDSIKPDIALPKKLNRPGPIVDVLCQIGDGTDCEFSESIVDHGKRVSVSNEPVCRYTRVSIRDASKLPLLRTPIERLLHWRHPRSAYSSIVQGPSPGDCVDFWEGAQRLFSRKRSALFDFDDDGDDDDDDASEADIVIDYYGDSFDDESVFSAKEPSSEEDISCTDGIDILANFERCQPRQKRIDREHKIVKTRDLGLRSYDLPPMMEEVEHMSTLGLDQHGRPMKTLVVASNNDENLYKFEIRVRHSTIPGASLGAFIQYLGSFHLKPEIKSMYRRIMENRTCHLPRTATSKEFTRSDGQLCALKLTGENLHGNDNKLYWPITQVPLLTSQDNTKTWKIHVTGEQIHDNHEFDALRARVKKHCRPIGKLGILLESDYVPVDAPFDAHNASIHIGRYGPVKKEDRKTESFFMCKSFIFQYEPSVYCFDVQERLRNENQVLDTSDDQTGMTHSDALKNIPTYVNEVGHDLSRPHNVFIVDYEHRSVDYSFVLPEKKTFGVGESSELFTNYSIAYETDRERNGYGLANLYKNQKSDDDYAAYLADRIRERNESTLQIAKEISIFQTCDILEKLRGSIYVPMTKLLETFLQTGRPVISMLQMVGLRRAFWLRSRFEEILHSHVASIAREYESCGPKKPHADVRLGSIEQCKQLLASIGLHDFLANDALTDSRRLKSGYGETIATAMEKEAVEEASFVLRKRLPHPFDDTIWCPVACDLVYRASILVAKHLWPVEQSSCASDVLLAQKELFDGMIALGEQAADEIRATAKNRKLSRISFGSGLREESILRGELLLSEMFRHGKRSKSVFLDHTTTPKSYSAAMMSKLSYIDCMMVGMELPQAAMEDTIVSHEDRFVMRNCGAMEEDEMFSELCSVPSSLANPSANDVNTSWYICWQVVFVVESFARAFCGVHDSTDTLCTRYGVPPLCGQYAVARGLQDSENLGYRRYCKPRTQLHFKKVKDVPKCML
mmetsp:Transcript_11814/g.32744  ORF Transcript_11814/g.32744 Transcript_11814/m.32744 type:complete len:1756 (+) Transcript_11814:258-5525(+)